MVLTHAVLSLSSLALATAQYGLPHVPLGDSSGTILRTDNGSYGPAVEEVHYYYVRRRPLPSPEPCSRTLTAPPRRRTNGPSA